MREQRLFPRARCVYWRLTSLQKLILRCINDDHSSAESRTAQLTDLFVTSHVILVGSKCVTSPSTHRSISIDSALPISQENHSSPTPSQPKSFSPTHPVPPPHRTPALRSSVIMGVKTVAVCGLALLAGAAVDGEPLRVQLFRSWFQISHRNRTCLRGLSACMYDRGRRCT